ncbi:hypothetical protein [Sinimarinibacterium sp. NLF-5-8]|uniref:hypothetical protein n=1 Tax=Sinimarinibacterium sp. NLF-5-8 TaxID=2698684 RepID=UPI00137C2369|nr:hypothetical protein [Sinimarinibacterium sp. NLF-5-8]QHS09583.1 hypothetical protein GT972_05005 [Sinimarinibacterium sp. NLF-5-8]
MSRWKALPTRKSQTPSSEPLPEAAAAPAESLPSAPPPGAGSKRRSGGGGNGLFWVLGGTVLLGAVVVGVMIAWWVFFHIVVYVHVQNQPAGITLPNEFEATGTLTNILDVTLNGEITAAVPFKQQLAVPFHGRYDFDVEFTAQVPIKFDVGYDGTIPVDTSADVTIHTGINYKNLKALRNLKIKTAIPMKFQLPVNLNIPVNDTVDLTYKGPLSADIDQDLQAPVSTVLNARLPVNQTIRAPVTAAVPLKIVPEKKQVRLLISDLVVALRPSSMLSFSLTDDASQPERVDNPYGPRDHGE